jgi:hypothetical protein
MLARWFVFWVLETALTQFYEDKSGQRARQKSVRISQNYVRKSAPGLLLRMYLDSLSRLI